MGDEMRTSTDYGAWMLQKRAERTVEMLKRHGFDAHFVDSIESARSFILDMTADYDSFGFPGSVTTRELGIQDALKISNKAVYDHWDTHLSEPKIRETRLRQLTCDCLLVSANAISMTGEIVNVDGMGNRVAAMAFGPKKVIIIAGMNKVVPDLSSALSRVREVAGPIRAKSLNISTPCTESGMCVDCNHPNRICRITTIMHRKPMSTDICVILVRTSLGF